MGQPSLAVTARIEKHLLTEIASGEKSLREVAGEHGVSHEKVRRVAARHGIDVDGHYRERLEAMAHDTWLASLEPGVRAIVKGLEQRGVAVSQVGRGRWAFQAGRHVFDVHVSKRKQSTDWWRVSVSRPHDGYALVLLRDGRQFVFPPTFEVKVKRHHLAGKRRVYAPAGEYLYIPAEEDGKWARYRDAWPSFGTR